MAFQHLSDAELEKVRDAAIAAGLTADLDSTVTGIAPAFVAQFMTGATPLARLLTLTDRMNQTRMLVGGKVPLAQWLSNAIRLAGGTEHELVFRHALAQVEADGKPAAEAAPDVAATPRHDGGALEIKIGEDDTLGVDFLLLGAAAARSVAKLRVHRHFDGQPSMHPGNEPDVGLGTGWMIGPGLLITNHHVVNARLPNEPDATAGDLKLQAAATVAEFDYLATDAQTTSVPVSALEADDPVLDYAVLRIDGGASGRPPLRHRASPLLRPQDRALQERVNVLQHPNGEPMRLGFRNNFVVTGAANRLSYLTDTAGGSSGSPICDDAWDVAGLHRGWETLATPVDVWGRAIGQENYGTPIARIVDDLKTRNRGVHDEVVAAQAALNGG